MRFIENNKFLILGWTIVMPLVIHYICTGRDTSLLAALIGTLISCFAHGASKIEE